MYRQRLRAVLPLAVVAVLALLPARPASAAVSGPCTATIDGASVGGHDTARTAIRVDHREVVSVAGSVRGGTARRVSYAVRLAGFDVARRGGEHLNLTGPTWSGDVAVRDYAWIAVGLFEVEGSAQTTAGPCVARSLVCVGGRPVVATVAGAAAAGLVALGLLVALAGMRRRRGAGGAAGLGLGGGVLAGVGAALLLQGTCTLALTRSAAIAVPIAISLLLSMAALLRNRLRARRNAMRLAAQRTPLSAPSETLGPLEDAARLARASSDRHGDAMRVIGDISTGETPSRTGAPVTQPVVVGTAAVTAGAAGVAGVARRREAWRPTHLAPDAGLSSWARPSPSAAPGRRVAGGMPVRQEERRGDWARVSGEDGPLGWVDGRLLRPLPDDRRT